MNAKVYVSGNTINVIDMKTGKASSFDLSILVRKDRKFNANTIVKGVKGDAKSVAKTILQRIEAIARTSKTDVSEEVDRLRTSFHKVGTLVRIAYSVPDTRPYLLPAIMASLTHSDLDWLNTL